MRIKGKAEIPFNWEEIKKSFIKEVAKKVTWEEQGRTARVERDRCPLRNGVRTGPALGALLAHTPGTQDFRRQPLP